MFRGQASDAAQEGAELLQAKQAEKTLRLRVIELEADLEFQRRHAAKVSVTAYIVMPYIDVACIVMAYIVMGPMARGRPGVPAPPRRQGRGRGLTTLATVHAIAD